MIAPDCGMKYLPRASAEGKMRAMAGAAALLRAELGEGGLTMQLVTEDNITELAAARWGTAHDPRLAEIMQALVRHLHDFAREVRLTEAEWMAAIGWLARTGQISDDKREEFILASDVLGLSMLVVQMNHRLDTARHPGDGAGPVPHRGLARAGVRRRHVAGPARHPALRHRHRPRPRRQGGRRGGARRVAGRHRRRLRGAAGRRRGPAAREVHVEVRRHLLRADDRAARATASRWTARSAT